MPCCIYVPDGAGNDNRPGGALPPYMTMRAALAEAMFMMNFEENADVVEATSYAPIMYVA